MSNSTEKMIVYFVASLVGKQKYQMEYKLIAEAFRKIGCTVWDDINNADPEKIWNRSKEQSEKYISEVQRKIKDADIFVGELSHASSSIGYEIGFAVGNSKPVLVLVKEGVPGVGEPFRGSKNKLLTVTSYTDSNLTSKIKSFVKKAEKGIFIKRLPIEFTQNQVEYVEFRQGRGVDRQSFNSSIREIVEEARAKDEKFKSFLAQF